MKIGGLLARPKCRWEESIKVDLKAMGWERVDWIRLDNNRDKWRDCCVYGNETSGSEKSWLSLDRGANYLSRFALLRGVL